MKRVFAVLVLFALMVLTPFLSVQPALADTTTNFYGINSDGYIWDTGNYYPDVQSSASGVVDDQSSYQRVGQTKGSETVTFYVTSSHASVRNFGADYGAIHDAAEGTILWNAYDSARAGQAKTNGNYFIWRDFAFFDTSSIPIDADITSAEFHIWGLSDNSTFTDFNIKLESGMPTYPSDPVVLADYDESKYEVVTYLNDGFYTDGFKTGEWNEIILNELGIAALNRYGTTKWRVVSDRDSARESPGGDEYVAYYSARSEHAPRLVVTYTTYDIYRGALFFDTSGLPDRADIVSVKLSLYGKDKQITSESKMYVTAGSGLGTPLAAAHYETILTEYDKDSRGEFDLATWDTSGYNEITLNPAGEGDIIKDGYTKLGLMTQMDAYGTAPAGDEYVEFWSQERGLGYEPKLSITYTITDLGDLEVALSIGWIEVYTNYSESDDQLYVFRTDVSYASEPDEDPKEYYFLQLLDEGSVVRVQTPLTAWGWRPASIYLPAEDALSWEGSYSLKIVGNPNKFASPPETTENLASAHWKGEVGENLDTWVMTSASRFGLEDEGDALFYKVQVFGDWKLDSMGSSIFLTGIPYLDFVRSHLFLYPPTQLPSAEDKGTAYQDILWASWGPTMCGYFNDVGEPLGVGGQFVSGLLFVAFMGAAIGVVWAKTQRTDLGIPPAALILVAGGLMGAIPLVFIALTGSLLFLLFFHSVVLKST